MDVDSNLTELSWLRSHLQVANVCSESYKPWRWIFLVTVFLLIDRFFQARPQLLVGAALLGLTWLHFVTSVTIEMSDILQIPIFTIAPSKTWKRAAASDVARVQSSSGNVDTACEHSGVDSMMRLNYCYSFTGPRSSEKAVCSLRLLPLWKPRKMSSNITIPSCKTSSDANLWHWCFDALGRMNSAIQMLVSHRSDLQDLFWWSE